MITKILIFLRVIQFIEWLKKLFQKTKVENITPVAPKKEIERRKRVAEKRGYTGKTYENYVKKGVGPINFN